MRLVVEFGAPMLVKSRSTGPAARLPGVRAEHTDTALLGICAESKCRAWKMVGKGKLRSFL